MLQTVNLMKKYDNHTILEDINFITNPGQITGIIGPNGVGKTTLLNIVSTLLKPSEGRVLYNGQDNLDKNSIRKKIGFVSHDPLLYLDFTPIENLNFFGALYRLNLTNNDIEELLEQVDLLSSARSKIRTFSRGMMQRLAFVKAIMHNPDFIFLDEPFAGLDLKACHIIEDCILSMKSKNKTILLVLHDLELGYKICDQILVLVNGRIVDLFDTHNDSYDYFHQLYKEELVSNERNYNFNKKRS